jgi:hypothetical protein
MNGRAHNFGWSLALALCAGSTAQAQQTAQPTPIAIIPLDSRHGGPTVTGALEVSGDRAMIAVSGTITAGTRTAKVLLPRRGELHLCASTTVRLAADASVPTDGGAPGLLLALDRGALELNLANRSAAGQNSDVLLTPDFRILVSGAGTGEIAVRLGDKGDTCIDNASPHAPYVLVSSLFEGGAYRVQSGQRVSFQHGSLHEVVDTEREPCGCPPDKSEDNEFPLAQSEGLAPMAAPKPSDGPVITAPLVHNGSDAATHTPASDTAKTPTASSHAKQKDENFFSRVGRFFRRIFGAE